MYCTLVGGMTCRLIAIVGPSGVGKESVTQAMAQAEPRIKLARRVITRPMGAGGEVFDCVSTPVFAQMKRAGSFSLWWTAHGLHYSIPKTGEGMSAADHDVLANLSHRVPDDAQSRFTQLRVITLTTDPDALRQRLHTRGREDHDDVTKRLQRAAFASPATLSAIRLDKSGPLKDTVQSALDALYHRDLNHHVE